MKKSILKIAAFTFTVSVILSGCNTPTEKVEKAQANVTEANADFTNAQTDYTTDVEKYRKETDAKIEANEKSMAEFDARIANEKKNG